MRVFVTGFGPFGEVTDNPSAFLAEHSGYPFKVMEVSYAAVDEELEKLAKENFDTLVMLGIAKDATELRLESLARNHVGETPDVRGVVAGPGAIDPDGPPQIHASLWTKDKGLRGRPTREMSQDAGSYLCNYALYQALRKFPEKSVGFIHVPSFDMMDSDLQLAELAEILAFLSS